MNLIGSINISSVDTTPMALPPLPPPPPSLHPFTLPPSPFPHPYYSTQWI